VDGRLEEEEAPDFVHEVLVALLIRALGNWAFPAGGFVTASEAKLVIDRRHGRKPDACVFLPDQPLPPRRGPITTAPAIAVEVVSPSPRDGRRDRLEKVAGYAAFGIRYYWIVDPELRSLEILELGTDGRYAHAAGATGGTLESVPGCPGLALDLEALWSAIDRLETPQPGADGEADAEAPPR